ncbi:MAG: (2Fe-2S) ferredoxin domain-containing protein [Oscillospiraceae bacterium]|nr:(2Fe-2S) ferredoxin domain-containing protein [Oscillospiraceae bacterium]
MKTTTDLQALRDKTLREMTTGGDGRAMTRIVVGLATCGIAAGARPVLEAFHDEIAKRGLEPVSVIRAGCIGMCQFEPIAEITRPGEEKITYGKVTPEMVARIVAEHLEGGSPVTEFTIGHYMASGE